MIWRKLIYFDVCLLLFVSLCRSQNHVVSEDLQNFLLNRLESTNNQLTSLLDQSSYTKDVQTDIEFYTPKTDVLLYPYVTANIFSLFNDTYVFMGDKLYQVNDTLELYQHSTFSEIAENVSFIKVVEYNNSGLIFFAFPSGHSQVFGYSNRQWRFIQSIKNANRASDAKFFVNQNNLYLIIANTVGDALTATSIYKWTETHFDEITKVLTTDAAAVLSFSDQDSEIILIFENSSNEHKHNLIAFEFNNDGLRKIQLLLAYDSKHIILYEIRGNRYLVIFEETENSTLYWWDGSEFVSWMKFENYKEIQKILATSIDEIPAIFLIRKDRLLVFSHSVNSLRLISKIKISEKYKEILDMQIISRNNTSVILTFMLTSENKLKYIVMPFTANFREVEKKRAGTDVLIQCLLNLKKHIEISQHKLDSVTESSQKIIQLNEPLEYSGRMNVGASVNANSANINSQFTSTRFQQHAAELKDRLNIVTNRINALNPKLETLWEGGSIEGKVLIKGELHAEQVLAKNLYLRYLNGKRWTPDMWLSYSKPQTITGPILCKELHTKNLNVSARNKIVEDFAFRNGSQNAENLSLLNSLTVNNMYVGSINNIPFEDVYLRSRPVQIQGVKKFDNLSVDKIDAIYLNQKAVSEAMEQLSEIASGNLFFSADLKIQNINVEEINGIHWNIFKDSVFRVGVTNRITGSLTGITIKSNELFAKTISKIDVTTWLTTETDQIVTSALHFAKINAGTIICKKINNINLENDVATPVNRLIKGPVSIENIYITGNLNIDGPTFSVTVREDHVIGTNETDLLQIYNSKVKIIGNLYLSNMLVPNAAKIIVNDEEFSENLSAEYWLKSQNQEIPTHFEAQNGISTPHLTTALLNNIAVNSFMVNNLDDKPLTNLLFENASILGNVFINPALPHDPDLERLDQESVKITGSYSINGRKSLQGKISIGNLMTNYLDEVKVSDVLTAKYSGKISGTKMFENFIVAENIVSNGISTSVLNNVDLNVLQDTALFIDKPVNVDTLRFRDVTVENVVAIYVNNNDFNMYSTHMNDVYTVEVLNDVVVNGNVQIKTVQELSHVNNLDVNSLLASLLKFDGKFFNKVRFLGSVYAENVEVEYINNVNFRYLVDRLLYRNWDQDILTDYKFDQLNSPNIYVPAINNVLVSNLIDTKNPNLQNLPARGVQLYLPKFLKSVRGNFRTCSLDAAISYLKNPPSRHWNTVHVSQNVTLWDDYSEINRILRKAVHSKRDNVISGNVVFQYHMAAKNVYLQKLINGVDINEIFSDAVLRDVAEQTITGRKRFGRLAASGVLVQGNADIPIVNEYNIAQLNESIVHKNDIHTTLIRGPKVFFSGLQAHRLITNQISDIDPQDIVSLGEETLIPEASFHSLEIDDNFDIEFVNGLNTRNVMKDRLFRFHNKAQVAYGTYHFQEQAYIIGDSKISMINGVLVDDIVLDVGVQNIPTVKFFKHSVMVNGSVEIGLLNRRNLSESYKQAILLGESNTIKSNITLNNVSSIGGNIIASSINGISTERLKELMQSKIPVINTEIIDNTTQRMTDVISRSEEISRDMPAKFLYLEKSTDIQIPVVNATSAYANEFNGTITLHVIRQERGSSCHLPDDCICPMEEIIHITPKYSAQDVNVHLFTDTVSTSEACRANQSKVRELTSTIVMFNQPKRLGHFLNEDITGYVSAVEFFQHNGFTYMFVSVFYDPVKNTHDLNCVLYKVVPTRLQLLQSIACNGAWTTHLFYTAQGITLITGSILTSEKINQGSGAEIYRFDPKSEQFMLLRKVLSSGCNTAAGVVIFRDSLIILAQYRSTSLQVLKYHPRYDNYYFYQSIFLDSPATKISVFYIGDYGISDAYLCVVTENGIFYVYSFLYVEGWQVVSRGEVEGLQGLVPFVLNGKHYLFSISAKVGSVLTVTKQGST